MHPASLWVAGFYKVVSLSQPWAPATAQLSPHHRPLLLYPIFMFSDEKFGLKVITWLVLVVYFVPGCGVNQLCVTFSPNRPGKRGEDGGPGAALCAPCLVQQNPWGL